MGPRVRFWVREYGGLTSGLDAMHRRRREPPGRWKWGRGSGQVTGPGGARRLSDHDGGADDPSPLPPMTWSPPRASSHSPGIPCQIREAGRSPSPRRRGPLPRDRAIPGWGSGRHRRRSAQGAQSRLRQMTRLIPNTPQAPPTVASRARTRRTATRPSPSEVSSAQSAQASDGPSSATQFAHGETSWVPAHRSPSCRYPTGKDSLTPTHLPDWTWTYLTSRFPFSFITHVTDPRTNKSSTI